MKKNTWVVVLALVTLFGVGLTPAHAAENSAPAVSAAPAAEPVLCAGEASAPAADVFVPQPLQMAPPVCQVFCITSECSKDSQCNAAPNGRCNLECPRLGCCVY
jgi:hypothetical protein